MKMFVTATIFLSACGTRLSSADKSNILYDELGGISDEEAKQFLSTTLPEAFPGYKVTNDALIEIRKWNNHFILCYVKECWPVEKIDGKIVNVAARIAESLIPASVEIRSFAGGLTRARVQKRAIALEIYNAKYLSYIIRYLDGYSFYAPYSIKFAGIDSLTSLPDLEWVEAEYFKNNSWHKNEQARVSFDNVGHLEEIYDGDLSLVLQAPAASLPTSGYWKGQFAEVSPWAQTIESIVIDGRILSNLGDEHLLPLGPWAAERVFTYEDI